MTGDWCRPARIRPGPCGFTRPTLIWPAIRTGKWNVVDFNFKTPAVCRMIVAEKSGPLWIGEDWVDRTERFDLFSFRPANFSPPAFAVEQQIPVQRLDYLLAGRSGGTWRFVDGRIEKWGSTQREKNLGPYPWGNDIIKAACEDEHGNLIVGTLGAGVFWYDAGRKIPANFDRAGTVVRLCPFRVPGP